jgi:hypothetical protein
MVKGTYFEIMIVSLLMLAGSGFCSLSFAVGQYGESIFFGWTTLFLLAIWFKIT